MIRYGYDDNGDLVSVSDREGNVTRMEYNPQREHYLDQIIDPLGREGVRNQYGEDGRLKKVFDANVPITGESFWRTRDGGIMK